MGFPRSVQWDESGTTLAIGTTGNAVCLVQPGDLTASNNGKSNGKPNGKVTDKTVSYIVCVCV
jgi:hypothetical protein